MLFERNVGVSAHPMMQVLFAGRGVGVSVYLTVKRVPLEGTRMSSEGKRVPSEGKRMSSEGGDARAF